MLPRSAGGRARLLDPALKSFLQADRHSRLLQIMLFGTDLGSHGALSAGRAPPSHSRRHLVASCDAHRSFGREAAAAFEARPCRADRPAGECLRGRHTRNTRPRTCCTAATCSACSAVASARWIGASSAAPSLDNSRRRPRSGQMWLVPRSARHASLVRCVAPGYSGAGGRFPAICGMPVLPIE